MMQFEQGALDSLYAAKRAIKAYENAQKGVPLFLDSGSLFATNDHLTTACEKINSFRLIANR